MREADGGAPLRSRRPAPSDRNGTGVLVQVCRNVAHVAAALVGFADAGATSLCPLRVRGRRVRVSGAARASLASTTPRRERPIDETRLLPLTTALTERSSSLPLHRSPQWTEYRTRCLLALPRSSSCLYRLCTSPSNSARRRRSGQRLNHHQRLRSQRQRGLMLVKPPRNASELPRHHRRLLMTMPTP